MQSMLTINIKMEIFIISPCYIYGFAYILARVRNLK